MKFLCSLALLVVLLSCNPRSEESVDVIIRNATIIDGTGSSSFDGDVVVNGDQIVFVGTGHSYTSETIIEGEGKVITPGFIDPHAHGDPFKTPEFHNFLAQGITTICLGQDGSSASTTDMAGWFESADSLDLGVNVLTLIGHGTIRNLARIPSSDEPLTEQLLEMEDLLSDGLKAGAFGLSTGLEYVPGYYAKEDELLALAKVVGMHDGLIMSHNRNEDDYAVDESVRELIRQGQYCRVQVSHLKVVYGKGKERALGLLNVIDSARKEGIEIYADVYPYTASYTGIGIVFPDYAKPPNDYENVKKSRRAELKQYITDKVLYRNGPEATLLGTKPWAGKTLKQVADSLEKHFSDVLIDDIGPGGASGAYFVMNEELQESLIAGTGIMVCTDGSPTMRHPRGYGSFAKVIREYTIEKDLFSLEKAVYKMSGLPAKSIGLIDRGVIRKGMKADLLLFDPQAIHDQADFQNPFRLSTGFDWIMLNGKVVKQNSTIDPNGNGMVVRKGIISIGN